MADLIPSLCGLLLSHAVDELKLLSIINNHPVNSAQLHHQTLAEKYEDKITQEDVLSKFEHEETLTHQRKAKKLQNIHVLLERTLEETSYDLLGKGTYNTLKSQLAEIEKYDREEENLLENDRTATSNAAKLQKEIEEGTVGGYIDNKNKEECIGKLKDDHEDLLSEFRIKEDYIIQWEESRMEQLRMRLRTKENDIKNSIRDWNNKIENEFRVRSELEAYTKKVIEDHHKTIEYWMEKYKQDQHDLDQKLRRVKTARMKLRLKMAARTAIYKERDDEMNNYKELKAQRRRDAEEKKRLDAKATRIQSWWRGVMVRFKLGPYKMKKPKPKGKGKSANTGKPKKK